jgi:glyoxylase-like metal-dependent hydrolase (beta-lactamase superfamily II)
MNVHMIAIGPLETNCCIIHTDSEAVVADVGGDPKKVLAYLKGKKLTLTHILLTHLHFDHTYGVRDLAAATGAKTLASDKDRYMLDNEMGRGGLWGLPTVPPYEFDNLEPGDLPLLGTVCRVLATPGHTPGGMSFYFESFASVFSGDCLFYRSVGRSDFPGGDQEVLRRSIQEQLYTLPGDTVVYPGHGLKTSIGDEKRNNPFVSDFKTV